MALIQNFINSSMYDYKCPYKMTPKGICVHNTGNDASADNEIAYMGRNYNEVSFHVAIDDKKAIQGIPFNRNAWHSGDGANGQGNRNYIAVEICYSKSGGERFDNAEIRASKEIALLMKQYNFNINNIKRHHDFSNKYCPHRTMDKGWERFLNMIKNELASLNSTGAKANATANEIYRIRKSWSDSKSQIGAYSVLENAIRQCKNGYNVYNSNGEVVHSNSQVINNTPKTTPKSTKKYLNLNPSVVSWRVYPLNKNATIGNEIGFLAPKQYGGLSYEILESKNNNVYVINTQVWGKVQIFAPRDNDSTITDSPIY